jgi:ABC-type polar amino acid transport system ATPase subunit
MIRLRGIEKSYPGNPVLQGVDLDFLQGEVAVLLGRSGAGKSTLLRTINGLETFERGTIQLDDIVLDGTAGSSRETAFRQIRRRVGMVFQQFNLFPHRTVLENVIEAPRIVLGWPRETAEATGMEWLARVGLADKAGQRPSQLSGGQQQRVAIARALAMQPEVVLFDEPTSSLDPRMTAEVTQVMRDLARSGQTMVVVTHDIKFAKSTAHKVHLLHQGRIVESGSPQQVLENSQNSVTRDFLNET